MVRRLTRWLADSAFLAFGLVCIIGLSLVVVWLLWRLATTSLGLYGLLFLATPLALTAGLAIRRLRTRRNDHRREAC